MAKIIHISPIETGRHVFLQTSKARSESKMVVNRNTYFMYVPRSIARRDSTVLALGNWFSIAETTECLRTSNFRWPP